MLFEYSTNKTKQITPGIFQIYHCCIFELNRNSITLSLIAFQKNNAVNISVIGKKLTNSESCFHCGYPSRQIFMNVLLLCVGEKTRDDNDVSRAISTNNEIGSGKQEMNGTLLNVLLK